jgi:hypothetical protein
MKKAQKYKSATQRLLNENYKSRVKIKNNITKACGTSNSFQQEF